MKKFVVVLVVCIGITVFADSKNVYHAIQNDYKNFYSTDSLYKMGIAFIVGGVAANSNIDQYLQNEYQNNLRNTTTDNISKTMKSFGEGRYTIPIALLATSLQYIKPESSVGKWGEYVSRSYFVGAPALLVMQRVTGGSRPGERDYNSRWKPFKDNKYIIKAENGTFALPVDKFKKAKKLNFSKKLQKNIKMYNSQRGN